MLQLKNNEKIDKFFVNFFNESFETSKKPFMCVFIFEQFFLNNIALDRL